jgi:hypothetical protein
VYADSTAVLGPLAHLAEPHSYDLCSEHADGLTAPRGWEVVRLVSEFPAEPAPSPGTRATKRSIRCACALRADIHAATSALS